MKVLAEHSNDSEILNLFVINYYYLILIGCLNKRDEYDSVCRK
jgi:hypothetical protein